MLANIEMTAVSEFVQQFGVLGILAWFLWYTTKVTIPNIHKHNNDLIEKIISDHRNTISEVTQRFSDDLRGERDARRLEITEERQLRKQEMQEIHDAMKSIKCAAN